MALFKKVTLLWMVLWLKVTWYYDIQVTFMNSIMVHKWHYEWYYLKKSDMLMLGTMAEKWHDDNDIQVTFMNGIMVHKRHYEWYYVKKCDMIMMGTILWYTLHEKQVNDTI